jgi:hypothetical protein
MSEFSDNVLPFPVTEFRHLQATCRMVEWTDLVSRLARSRCLTYTARDRRGGRRQVSPT